MFSIKETEMPLQNCDFLFLQAPLCWYGCTCHAHVRSSWSEGPMILTLQNSSHDLQASTNPLVNWLLRSHTFWSSFAVIDKGMIKSAIPSTQRAWPMLLPLPLGHEGLWHLWDLNWSVSDKRVNTYCYATLSENRFTASLRMKVESMG